MSNTQYHPVSLTLHWVIAGLIAVQFVLSKLAQRADNNGSAIEHLALLANHRSVGITILALAIGRLVWRWRVPPPALPASTQRWQVIASKLSHWSLYSLLFMLPISGWLMSSASADSVSWFNIIRLPDFVAPDTNLKESLQSIHELLGNALLALAGLHLLAALKHHIVDEDDVLRRMTPLSYMVLFGLVAGLGISMLGRSDNPYLTPTVTPDASGPATHTAPSDLAAWRINYVDSYIRFAGDQAGAEFGGDWQEWTARIQFDDNNLPDSRFNITISTSDVDTLDDERDTTLQYAEWFDPGNHPQAYYRASDFAENGDDTFTANGQLIIKGQSVSVPLIFSVNEGGSERLLTGSATILRPGVGSGEWEDATRASNAVTIDMRVSAVVR